MNIEYWKKQQNNIQHISAPHNSLLTLNYYEDYVKKLYDFIQNKLYEDFSKQNIAEAFGLILICVSCAHYDMKTVQSNPPAERFVFKTLDDAINALLREIHTAKYSSNDVQCWRFIWRGLWVATFKSKISEQDIIDYFYVDDIIQKWLRNNDTDSDENNSINDNTMIIVESLRNNGHDWDSISTIIGIDTTCIKNEYINHLENK
ncbi:hypothetical protein PBI_SCTP2_270 [Salicola phage SCTP-2]|nr:hypothetical protein PBI_SCTP2_270 [Salicola phage SCTP-2]